MEWYLRVNLLGPIPRLMNKEFTAPRSHKGWETFLDHTQRRTTVGRIPLNKSSARRKDLYLTTHNTTDIHAPLGIRTNNLSSERPQTYALDRAATGNAGMIQNGITGKNSSLPQLKESTAMQAHDSTHHTLVLIKSTQRKQKIRQGKIDTTNVNDYAIISYRVTYGIVRHRFVLSCFLCYWFYDPFSEPPKRTHAASVWMVLINGERRSANEQSWPNPSSSGICFLWLRKCTNILRHDGQ
jgi:hypothetical protein